MKTAQSLATTLAGACAHYGRSVLTRLDGAALILGLALLGGLLLRVLGSDFCLPMEHCHPDEHYLVTPAERILRTGNFNPGLFVYPSLFIYLLSFVFALTFLYGVSQQMWSALAQLKRPLLIHAGRLTTALLGTGTIAAVYFAGRRLFDRQTAAVAALVLAVMPLHVSNSHFITTDVPAAFFTMMALWAAVAVTQEGGRRSYLWLGLLVGLAAATKYNAALVLINLPLAHWLNPRRQRFFDAQLLRALGWVALGFLIACPYALLDLPRFLDGLASEMAHYGRGHVGHSGEHNRIFYLLFLASRGFGPVLFGLGAFGLVTMARRWDRRYLLLLAFPLVYLLFVGGYKVRFVRNLMPILPYLALWIGFGAVQAFRQVRARWPLLGRPAAWKVALPALLVALSLPAAISIDETAALAAPDARLQARAWIEQNLPRDATLHLQSWSVDALTPGKFQLTREGFCWDYYVATDRLSRKYFGMQQTQPHKYAAVKEAFQHRPVARFKGRKENPFYYTASPEVLVFARDQARPRVRQPAKAPSKATAKTEALKKPVVPHAPPNRALRVTPLGRGKTLPSLELRRRAPGAVAPRTGGAPPQSAADPPAPPGSPAPRSGP